MAVDRDGGAQSGERTKRKGETEEEAMVRRTIKFLKKSGNTDEVAMITNDEHEVEDGDWDEGDHEVGVEVRDRLDEEMVRKGRKEESEYMADKLEMFEFGDYAEAKRRGGKEPTTTKWVEGKKVDEDSNEFVRCRLVARDFRCKREGPRDDLFAAMPPLEVKKALFAMVAGERGRRRRKGREEIKLMYIDVKKAHLNAKCDEEEWVELPCEFWKCGKYARLRRWLYGMRKAASGWEDDYARRLIDEGFIRGVGAPTVFFNPETMGEGGGAR